MTSTRDTLAAALHAHAHQAHPDKPEPFTAGFRGWTALKIMACVVAEARPQGPLMQAAGALRVRDGRTVLGPAATAVLDRLLGDEVDTTAFFDVLIEATKKDLAPHASFVGAEEVRP